MIINLGDSQKKWKKGSGKFKIYLEKSENRLVKGSRLLVQSSLSPFPQPIFPFEKNWSEYFQAKGIYGSAFISSNAFILLNDAVDNKNISYFDSRRYCVRNHSCIILIVSSRI